MRLPKFEMIARSSLKELGRLGLALLAAGAVVPPAFGFPATRMEGPLAEAAQRSRGTAAAGAIYRDGQVVEMYVWGAADCFGNGAADPDRAFETGSIAKHMTAVGLLRLWERGLVDLDAPVGRYLSDIPEPWKRATIRQIATHTGGIPDYEEAATYAIYETSPTVAELLSWVAERPLDFEPGTQWSYSNTGYVLLSLVIEKLTGQRYGDFMRDELFAPLGLRETFVAGRAPAGLELVQGCKPAGPDGAERSPVRPISEASTYGAAGVLSTLEDWALWDDALSDGRLLSGEAMAILTTPQTLADGARTDYGFGLEIGDFRGRRSISHSGQTQGFTALYETYPDQGAAVMVWVNQYGSNPAPLFDALRIRALPEASYDRLPAAEDPDPALAEAVGIALRQYYLGQAGPDRLDPELRAAATSPATATSRARLRPIVSAMTGLQFVRSRPRTSRPGETVLYRVLGEGRLGYFSVGVRDGVVDRIFWEQE